MTVEFKLLIWSLGLTFVQMLIAVVGTILLFSASPRPPAIASVFPNFPAGPAGRGGRTST